MTALKPCPFCGGTSIAIHPDEYGSGGQHVSPYHASCDMTKGGCGVSVIGETDSEAIATWNRRAEVEAARAALAAPGAAVPAEPDMLAICAALGFDPTNHHNAAKCPYCRPALEERELPPLPPTPYRCLSDLQSGTMPVWTEHQMREYARAAIDSHTKGEK